MPIDPTRAYEFIDAVAPHMCTVALLVRKILMRNDTPKTTEADEVFHYDDPYQVMTDSTGLQHCLDAMNFFNQECRQWRGMLADFRKNYPDTESDIDTDLKNYCSALRNMWNHLFKKSHIENQATSQEKWGSPEYQTTRAAMERYRICMGVYMCICVHVLCSGCILTPHA